MDILRGLRKVEFWIVLAVTGLYIAWLSWPAVLTGSANARMVGVFSQSEQEHLLLIRDTFLQHTFHYYFISYGHLHFNLTLLALFLLEKFRPVTEQDMIIVLRLIPAIFAAGAITATFILARQFFGRTAAWMAVLVFLFIPQSFLQFSFMSRPDVIQVFFLILGLFFCMRLVQEGSWKWLLWASLAAGLGFSAKFSGMFLIPILILARLLSWFQGKQAAAAPIGQSATHIQLNPEKFSRFVRWMVLLLGGIGIVGGIFVTPGLVRTYLVNPNSTRDLSTMFRLLQVVRLAAVGVGAGLVALSLVKRFWKGYQNHPALVYLTAEFSLALIVFATAFVLTSPFSLVRLSFLKGIVYESGHTSFGHLFEADPNPLLWFNILSRSNVLGIPLLLLLVISLAAWVYQVYRTGWKAFLSPVSILWAWVLFYMSFLMLRVHYRAEQYSMPLIPFVIILSILPISQGIRSIQGRMVKRPGLAPVSFAATLLILLGLSMSQAFGNILAFREYMLNREEENTALLVGDWLAAHYAPSIQIVYDKYSYVPPVFQDALEIGKPSPGALEALRPQVIVIDSEMSDRFTDPGLASVYRNGENEFMQAYAYYASLKDGRAGYSIVRDFGTFQVYERR